MIGAIVKSAAVVAAGLVIGDVAGIIVLTIGDIVGLAFPALTYVVWFVLGVFVGLLSYNLAGAWCAWPARQGVDWTALPMAKRTGSTIVAVQIALILGFCWWFDLLYWSQGVVGDYYVPDSMPHSLTYFLAAVGAIVLARFMLMPAPDAKRGRD